MRLRRQNGYQGGRTEVFLPAQGGFCDADQIRELTCPMPAAPALENLLRRDQLIVAAMLGSIVLPAWGYMAYEAHAMYHSGASCCVGMSMAGPDANPWSAATL